MRKEVERNFRKRFLRHLRDFRVWTLPVDVAACHKTGNDNISNVCVALDSHISAFLTRTIKIFILVSRTVKFLLRRGCCTWARWKIVPFRKSIDENFVDLCEDVVIKAIISPISIIDSIKRKLDDLTVSAEERENVVQRLHLHHLLNLCSNNETLLSTKLGLGEGLRSFCFFHHIYHHLRFDTVTVLDYDWLQIGAPVPWFGIKFRRTLGKILYGRPNCRHHCKEILTETSE